MKIEKIRIANFKCFDGIFEATFNAGLNIIVGDNESGKSTILEAIHLVVNGLFNGRMIRNELSANLFNIAVQERYLDSLSTATPLPPPNICIEAFFSGSDPQLAQFEGNGNSEKVKASGIMLSIEFDDDYLSEYNALVNAGEVTSLPIEYYKVSRHSFARHAITSRMIPIRTALIDSSNNRTQAGSDVYVARIVKDSLDDKERIAISQAHRKMRDGFVKDPSVQAINTKINTSARISQRSVTISVDLSSQSAWENSLTTYIDRIPFHYIGKGEQCIVKTKLALSSKRNNEATTLLIEEPENHLSHSNLNRLLSDIVSNNGEKQIIVSTHSSFVANKLGLENLILLRDHSTAKITQLGASEFFQKLAGYDTLRLVLSAKAILVEGDSDELVVQRAYMDNNNGKLPIENGIDVISVGTSFLRFLEIADALKIPVAVVTDNDGDVSAVQKKYAKYVSSALVHICYDPIVDSGSLVIGTTAYNYNTLEPKLLKANSLTALNSVFGKSYTSEDELRKYMKSNKTDCALAIFRATSSIKFPDYILSAIAI
ncbi:MAG: AAA family ATPase [Gammaproteobacteria bacterium]